MFDISWTEFLLIGVVALMVIGPKELPGVLRTLGQWTRKVRSMATEFQNQFQEAMREAEMADLKKTVDDMAHDLKDFDPLKDVRSDIESAGKDIERSITTTPESKTDTPAQIAPAAQEAAPAQIEAAASAPPVERGELAPAEAETAPSTEPAAQTVAPDSTSRSA